VELNIKGKKVVCLLGPTSSGKTSIALKLCKELGGEIVSVDSRQVIKKMDIGTGKVPILSNLKVERGDTNWKIDGVKVWGYDVFEPDQYFSAIDFIEFISKIEFQEKYIFFVGGTGFYFDLLLGNAKTSGVLPDLKLREIFESKTKEELYDMLEKKDSDRAGKIDRNNKVRLIRALEIAEKSGQKTIAEQKPLYSLKEFEPLVLGLKPDRKWLYERADHWVEEIFSNGLLDEVNKLSQLGYKDSKPMQGLVYKTVLDLFEEKFSLDEACQLIKFDIHAYIRRQESYFNRIKGVSWFDSSKNQTYDAILNLASEL
jgi:tRNA dimethylallyltransferase